jgi:MSHA biogenesis protein MshJ
MTIMARWRKFAARIDAMTPRERLLALAATLAVLVFIAWMAVLGPAFRKQDALRRQIGQQRDTIAGIEAETAHKIAAGRADPDAPLRERLGAVRQESARMTEELRAMQKGLVAPERIAPLLETILRANGRLKLVSLKTLPVASHSDMAARESGAGKAGAAPNDASAAPKAVARAPDLLFAHGVELTMRGSYLDMVDYMTTLEALPTQLFWGRAQLDVEQYPSVRLTLTLYTLSLDQKWMKL